MRTGIIALGAACFVALTGLSLAQDAPQRKELKRVDLSGAPGMEVVTSISEYKPGEELGRHFHHGVEAGYVMQGAMVQAEGKDPFMVPTGAPFMHLRDTPHGGYKIVGETSLKLYAVHVVDKGKPLFEWVK